MAGGKLRRLKIFGIVAGNRQPVAAQPAAAPPAPARTPQDSWIHEICSHLQRGVPSALELRAIAERWLRRTDISREEWSGQLRTALNSHDARVYLLASCAHILTAQDARALLTDILNNANEEHAVRCISIMGVVQAANSDSVQASEGSWAHFLSNCLRNTMPGLIPGTIMKNSTFSANGTQDLPLGIVPAPLAQKIVLKFAQYMSSLHQGLQWSQASQESSWMAGITESSPMGNLLNTSFPQWRAWAAWRPDQNRINNWATLLNQRLQLFGDIIRCEGPDYRDLKHPTIRAGFIQHPGDYGINSLVENIAQLNPVDAIRVSDGLLMAFDAVISLGDQTIGHFQEIYGQRPLEVSWIEGLTSLAAHPDLTALKTALKIQGARTHGMKVAGALAFLERVPDPNNIAGREDISALLQSVMQKGLADAQDKLCKSMQEGLNPQVHLEQIMRIVSAIQASPTLVANLRQQTQDFLGQIPTKSATKAYFDIREIAVGLAPSGTSPLVELLNAFCFSRFGGRETVGIDSLEVVHSLISFWEGPPDRHLRDAAMRLAGNMTMPDQIRATCLNGLVGTPRKVLREAEKLIDKPGDATSHRFARMLLFDNVQADGEHGCWHLLLQWLVVAQGPSFGSSICHVDEWFSFMGAFQQVSQRWPRRPYSERCILHPSYMRFTQEIAQYKDVLLELEEMLGAGPSMQFFLRADGSQADVRAALELLSSSKRQSIEPLVDNLLKQASRKAVPIKLVVEALHRLHVASQDGVRRCSWIQEMLSKHFPAAELFATSWCGRRGLRGEDRAALESVAGALGVRTNLQSSELQSRATAAADYLDGRVDAVIGKLKGLEAERYNLQRSDADSVEAAMRRVGIRTGDERDNAASVIPDHYLNTISELNTGHFELFFPLPNLNEIQRQAMALDTETTGIVIYVQKTDQFNARGVCVHLYPNNCGPDHQHTLWQGTGVPDDHTCDGLRNRSVYHLTRIIASHISQNGTATDTIYNIARTRIGELGAVCIVCSNALVSALWRSTTCSRQCSIKWRRASLEVRMSDLSYDPRVVDLLVTAAYAAASANVTQLLVDCPLTGNVILSTVNQIPAITTLQQAANTAVAVRQLGRSVELLLSWALHSYRGFLVSPTGPFSVCNNLAGVTEFLLVNPEPTLQDAFIKCGMPTRVVFHGTSLDRLYAILRGGLRILSGDNILQRHGAAYGQGIYAADEPSVAFNYAGQWRGGWTNSSFQDVRVLLGCELAGQHTHATPGIYVIPNEKAIMVRYIFIIDRRINVPPTRAVIEPRMAMVFASLRQMSTYRSFWSIPGADA